MKKLFSFVFAFVAVVSLGAQSVGYYNGTEGLKGDALKSALHQIIDKHLDYGYANAKYILNYADEDPENSDNFIQLYTNRSVSKLSWGTGGDKSNKEHIWAASHGDFREINPMTGDGHNLHAADASTNIARSNFDFDEVTGGTYIEEADAYYNESEMKFEPADRDKGIIARTILYMAVRYEGDNGELDFEVVDRVNTSSSSVAEHGKLSTLLKWNRAYPPTDFERRRNERVFEYQGNRNPFIDNPGFADLIWADESLSGLTIGDVMVNPNIPIEGEQVSFSAKLTGATSAKLLWGDSFETTNEAPNASSATSDFEVNFVPLLDVDGIAHIKIVAFADQVSDTLYATLKYPKQGIETIPISEVQGTADASPLVGQKVSITGVVTADLGSQYYVQSSSSPRSGVLLYGDALRGNVGDSVLLTATVTEYNNLTELQNIAYFQNCGPVGKQTPKTISIAEVGEDYEGMFVLFEDVTFEESGTFANSKTYTIKQGTSSISMYLSYGATLVGATIPTNTVDLACIISQYSSNYQIVVQDISWVNYGTTSALFEVEDESNVQVYPIPAHSGIINVISEEPVSVLNVFTISGQLIESSSVSNVKTCQLDVSALPSGHYLLQIIGDAIISTRNIVIE